MFSIVQNISTALNPVKAGQSVGDRKHAFDHNQNENQSSSEEDVLAENTEGSVLSVQALIMFLEDFLETHLEAKRSAKSMKEEKKNTFSKWLGKDGANSNDASVQPKQAANVYAHTAQATKNYVHKNTSSDNLSHADLKDIYDLIRDLRQLRERGVFHLQIASDRSFLDSIKQAVAHTGISE